MAGVSKWSDVPDRDANTVTPLAPEEKRRLIERIHRYLRKTSRFGRLSAAVDWVAKAKQFELLAATDDRYFPRAGFGATFSGLHSLVAKMRKREHDDEIEEEADEVLEEEEG